MPSSSPRPSIRPSVQVEIQPQFVNVLDFSGGRAAATIDGDHWGFIDKTGKFVIQAKFAAAGYFNEGVAAAAISVTNDWGGVDLRYGIVNRQGRWTAEPRFDYIGRFYDGSAPAQDVDSQTWGYINTRGQWILRPQWTAAWQFAEGLAPVQVGGDKGKWGFINGRGKWVISPQFWAVGFFQEGLAPVASGDQSKPSWGYIDKSGEWVVDAQFGFADAFAAGLAVVESSGQYGFVDRQGRFRVSQQFDDVGFPWTGPPSALKEGVAAVRVGNAWGFVDRLGNYLLNPTYLSARSLSDGLAAFAASRGDSPCYVGDPFFPSTYQTVSYACQWGFLSARGIDIEANRQASGNANAAAFIRGY